MTELNNTQSVEVFDQDDFDSLTVVDMGDGIIALSQVAEDGTLHNIILGGNQSEKLAKLIIRVLG